MRAQRREREREQSAGMEGKSRRARAGQGRGALGRKEGKEWRFRKEIVVLLLLLLLPLVSQCCTQPSPARLRSRVACKWGLPSRTQIPQSGVRGSSYQISLEPQQLYSAKMSRETSLLSALVAFSSIPFCFSRALFFFCSVY